MARIDVPDGSGLERERLLMMQLDVAMGMGAYSAAIYEKPRSRLGFGRWRGFASPLEWLSRLSEHPLRPCDGGWLRRGDSRSCCRL